MMRRTEGHLDDRARRSIQVSLDFSPGVVIKNLIQRQRSRAHQVLPVFKKGVFEYKVILSNSTSDFFFHFFFQLYLNRLSKKSIVSFLSFSYGDNFFFFFPSSCNLWKKENYFFLFLVWFDSICTGYSLLFSTLLSVLSSLCFNNMVLFIWLPSICACIFAIQYF